MLKAENISVNYGVCDVVRNVSFEVSSGEVLFILGANGAGKTTLLRALNNALPVTKGEILIDEKPLEKYSRAEIARKIAVVAQENELKFPVTVLEFVLGGRFAHGRTFGWETAADLTIAKTAMRESDLINFEKRIINRLSGGERQRAVFARALASGAKLLLLDEPTANLDLAHQVLLLKLVREKCKQENFGAVVITHDLNLAAAFADKILLLKNGQIVAEGRTEDVLTETFVQATFGVEVLIDLHPIGEKLRVTTIY